MIDATKRSSYDTVKFDILFYYKATTTIWHSIMATYKTLKISDLKLDLENPRFPEPADNQRDAINIMLENQGERLILMAKDIADKGTDPSDNPIVVLDEDGLYIVAEGNRRISALKLLNNPELSNTQRYKDIFQKIKLSMARDIDDIMCAVFENDDSYEHWVTLKHTGQNSGVGRVAWTNPEKERHLARHGNKSFQYQIYYFMEQQKVIYKDILKLKKHIKMTNISRLLGTKEVRECFALESIDGYLFCHQPYESFLKDLGIMLHNMVELNDKGKAAFNVNRIRSKNDRIEYIHELGIFKPDHSLVKPWRILDCKDLNPPAITTKEPEGEFQQDSKPGNTEPNSEEKSGGNTNHGDVVGDKKKQNPPPKSNRNNLIPPTLKPDFGTNKKCHRIFNELKHKLTYEDHINSISVMLRVFIDLSVSDYVERNHLKIAKNPGHNPGLHDKVILSAQHLRENNKLTGSECTAVLAYSSNTTKAQGTLQQYVHNGNIFPHKDLLNAEWDNFQPLMMSIWS